MMGDSIQALMNFFSLPIQLTFLFSTNLFDFPYMVSISMDVKSLSAEASRVLYGCTDRGQRGGRERGVDI
jgi:hypothetical protein